MPNPTEIRHKGYRGSVEYSDTDRCFFGKILGISDLVSYEGDDIDELTVAFEIAVSDHIETLSQLEKEK